MIYMIDQYEQQLNCKEHLRDKFEILKEAFIEYYGEERRQEIEKKFSKALLIAYRRPDYTLNILSKISKIYTSSIVQEMLKKIPSNWTEEDLIGKYDFENPNIIPLAYFKKFYELYQLGAEKREEQYKEKALQSIQAQVPEFTKEEYEELIKTKTLPEKYSNLRSWVKENILYKADLSNPVKEYERLFKEVKNILEKIKPDVTVENVSEIMENEDIKAFVQYANQLPEMTLQYEYLMKKYESFKENIEKQTQIKQRLSNEFYLKLIIENIDLLGEEDKKQLEIFKGDLGKSYVLTSYTTFIFGYGLGLNSPLEAFSKESEEVLRNPEQSDWKKQSIKEDRIHFFQKNGINLGDDYETYLDSEEVKRIWPSTDRVEKFIESKNRLQNEFNNEYYTNLPEHQDTRKEIDTLHLLDQQDGFDAALYSQLAGPTFVNPNIVKTTDGYDVFSLVVVCCDILDGTIDHNIIHELNHLFELTLSRVEGNSYEAISGWDMCTGTLNEAKKTVDTIHTDKEKRGYELFNEIINEMIAQEIYTRMLEKGEHIFDTKETAKVKHTTSYENTFFLIRDFFQEFKKEILESRSNGHIEIIWNKAGKENFDELNNLFRIFNENFQGFKYYELLNSLKDNQDNKLTKIYKELVEKRDQILDKMRKHSMMQELTSEEKSKETIK